MFLGITFLLLSSCNSVDRVLHPNNYIPRDTPLEKEYIHDTIRISNDQGKLINSNIAGFTPTKQLVFTSIGQTFNIKPGQSFEIVAENIDFSNTTFDIETNEATGEIKLKLVDKDFSKVKLEYKCQTILRTGIDFVPKIELADGLDPEQIVVTPVFDDNCKRIGFQIRYGSEERGCRKEAQEILDKFRNCSKNTSMNNSKNGNKTKGSLRLNGKKSLYRKLGIPIK